MLFCFEDVKAFQTKFGVPMPSENQVLNDDAYNFRLGFLNEEKQEFIDSHVNKDFEGCIDALLDEVYVACGTALMMGVTSTQWLLVTNHVLSNDLATSTMPRGSVAKRGLHFLEDEEYNHAVGLLDLNLHSFVHFHFYGDVEKCTNALASIVLVCYDIANAMGIDMLTYTEMWDDVQRANMTKVRATDASQSKRKSSLDVIKPAGWVGPNGGKILDKNYPGWREKL